MIKRVILLATGGFSHGRVAQMHGEAFADGFEKGLGRSVPPRKRSILDRWELRNAERAGFDPIGQQMALGTAFLQGDFPPGDEN